MSIPRPPHRRRPAPTDAPGTPPAEPSAPAPASVPAPAPPPAPVRRAPTDLAGFRQVADMDRAEVDALLDEFAPRKGNAGPRKGQRIRASVSRVTTSTVFFDVGGKSDAAIDRAELEGEVAVGEVYDLYVVGTEHGELRLTRTISGDATREMLDEVRAQSLPVQGRVTGRNEGGFEVLLSGGIRAFCPVSQIDHEPEPDLDAYVGRSLAFRVIDVRGRDAVVSHRGIAEEEARAEQGRRFAEVREGEVHDGTVTSLREFGAFVRLGNGVEGLVHLSNIGEKRIKHPSEALQVGQAVRVRVLSVDAERKRLGLGIRQVDGGDAPADAGPSSQPGSFGTLGGLLAGVKVRR